jgi:GDP-L-fucose synthase
MNKSAKIFIAGHRGMVGSAIVRSLQSKGYTNLITATRDQLDLIDQKAVYAFLENERPEYVFIAAAKVGGIHANKTYRADFIFQNLSIQSNLIHGAHLAGIQKLMFLGSSCIYPRECPQPIKESYLLTGSLEPTNEMYAIAKIAGIKLCESYNRQYGKSHGVDYRSIMPTNLYGPGDNYHPENSHVIPGLIYRFHKAKINNLESITVWGTGTPKREFLYVDDLAQASIYVMNLDKKIYDEQISSAGSHINVGSGKELSIKELAETIKEVIDFKGKINFDLNKSDGSLRKLLNSERINKIGFKSKTGLKEGLIKTYQDYIKK